MATQINSWRIGVFYSTSNQNDHYKFTIHIRSIKSKKAILLREQKIISWTFLCHIQPRTFHIHVDIFSLVSILDFRTKFVEADILVDYQISYCHPSTTLVIDFITVVIVIIIVFVIIIVTSWSPSLINVHVRN